MIASFKELEQANDTEYVEVQAYGMTVRLGSLNSEDMIEWVESEEGVGIKRSARVGLKLIVRSLVDAEGNRIPKDQVDKMVDAFGKKNSKSNGLVIAAALKLNGLDKASAKNDSGEGASVTLPTGSPSPPAT